ncbi:transmembrane protein 138 isoform X1 [Mustela nigripes]|nr:transmembrane protein 138 isoform X1 [Mustela nigripes]XP_059260563.1 transmembrane protein 138 isoform X1 [Mustela nigripes]
MLQTSNYSLVLSLQFLLLSYDLFVNSFSELLRTAPVIQLVLFIIQDIAILFNIIIIFLMFFNTFVFQAGLVNLLFHKFKGTIILTAVYFALSISLHVWVMNLRWKNSNRFVWTDGLQTLFVFQRLAAVLYCYFYKRTAVRLGDPRFYQDSLWLRKEFTQVQRTCPPGSCLCSASAPECESSWNDTSVNECRCVLMKLFKDTNLNFISYSCVTQHFSLNSF